MSGIKDFLVTFSYFPLVMFMPDSFVQENHLISTLLCLTSITFWQLILKVHKAGKSRRVKHIIIVSICPKTPHVHKMMLHLGNLNDFADSLVLAAHLFHDAGVKRATCPFDKSNREHQMLPQET